MSSKKFRVELGINLHAATIPKTNPNMRLFPLQNALIDVTAGERKAKPAWYSRLHVGDEISFRLVDLSSLRVPETELDYPDMAVAELLFSDPVSGRFANPFAQKVVEWRIADKIKERKSPVYGQEAGQRLPTWNLHGYTARGRKLKSLTFAKCPNGTLCRAFELTVVLKSVVGAWVNHFVFDPEMIVSETDSGGGEKRGSGR